MIMNPTFDVVKNKWKTLMIKGKKEEAKKLYWEKMFPFIEKKFVKETQEMIKRGEIPQYDLLVTPLGLKPSYHIILINGLRPKKVYFICTKEGEKYSLDKVIRMTRLKQEQYKKDVIEYEGRDLSIVYEKIKKRIKMFQGKKIAVDLTRGSRIVAAGAAIVGDFFGCDLIYIEKGWIQELRSGEPGKEKLVKIKNPLHIFGDLEQRYANELFNRYQYIGAKSLFEDLRNRVKDPREFEIKFFISECYNFWDSFNYRSALQILEKVIYRIKQYGIKIPDSKQLERNLSVLKYLSATQYSKKKFIEVLKDNNLIIHLLIDIFCNAQRRAEEEKFEDSISRFYRLIELVSQHRLAKMDIYFKDPDYGKLNINVSNRFRQITKEIYKEEKELLQWIGLMDGHIILFAVNDDIWKNKNLENLKELHEAIKLRDYSFIAHGIQIVSKDIYKKLKNITKDLLKTLCNLYDKDFDSLIIYHRFLKL